MATDVSSFKDAYKTAITGNFPDKAVLAIGEQTLIFEKVPYDLRYGTNPHQPFAAYAPVDGTLSVGNLEMLKGGKAGLSLTNIQDMSQALNILKYFDKSACVAMKHINPCGFKVKTKGESTDELYRIARKCDDLSHFGAVVGFNTGVDETTAEAIMETFVECVIAPDYSPGAITILNKNEGTTKLNNSIRVAKFSNLDRLPKFIGDSTKGMYNIRNLADGTLTLETPYLTRIRSVADFVTDPMIPADLAKGIKKDYTAEIKPIAQELADCLTAWYLCMNTRSNGVIFVRDGMALAVGTGQQSRIDAVKDAIKKAKERGHSLEGSVMASDGFFPKRDCIDVAAEERIKAIVWPAGSQNDWRTIEAANEYDIALIATLERCFLHI